MDISKPSKPRLPEDARPLRGTVVSIEDPDRRVVIWLELSDEERSYRVRKIVESKGQSRH